MAQLENFRVTALQMAIDIERIRIRSATDFLDANSVLENAEKFYEFLTHVATTKKD